MLSVLTVDTLCSLTYRTPQSRCSYTQRDVVVLKAVAFIVLEPRSLKFLELLTQAVNCSVGVERENPVEGEQLKQLHSPILYICGVHVTRTRALRVKVGVKYAKV